MNIDVFTKAAIDLVISLKGFSIPKNAELAYNKLCQAIAEAEKQEPVAKDQWWVKELEGFWGSADYQVTLDTRRAAKTALGIIFKPADKPLLVEQEPVAWRYKPNREDNPRWEYTTQHPLDMGDGYLRPTLVEYCKCIEPLYVKEKPKLMLEKFREMEALLDDATQQEPATKEQIREAIIFNLPLYTHPQPKRKWVTLEPQDMPDGEDPMYDHPFFIAGMVWTANKLKEKNHG